MLIYEEAAQLTKLKRADAPAIPGKEIVLFEYDDVRLEVPMTPEQETVWLNRIQMSELFERDIKTIGKHIANVLRDELAGQEVVAKFATTTRHGALEGKMQTHMTEYYNLDVIISVGYRVKSQLNNYRINELGELIRIMKRVENTLDSGQELYSTPEEKAEHLLYFVTKNHSFYDGNKRIAATMFLYFLDKNNALFADGKKMTGDDVYYEKYFTFFIRSQRHGSGNHPASDCTGILRSCSSHLHK